jgi:predicted nuclease with TOPRIM domain
MMTMNGLDRRRAFENIQKGYDALEVWVVQEDTAMDEIIAERDKLEAECDRLRAEVEELRDELEACQMMQP